jgi:hypothetical protein
MKGHTMSNQNHRGNAVTGLRALADFLYTYDLSAKLNTASRITVQYCILEEDNAEARREFTHLMGFMFDAARQFNARCTSDTREHADTRQHTADLIFGNGTVAYQVLWIEKTEEAGQ